MEKNPSPGQALRLLLAVVSAVVVGFVQGLEVFHLRIDANEVRGMPPPGLILNEAQGRGAPRAHVAVAPGLGGNPLHAVVAV